ncbi:MAG: heavy-metal-associated domain-containing protein [Gammaproteobacteria bacterium]|nr:heavy-metal-associated domain-containing protein [Gammaproteobacteria bacterium]
MKQTFEVDNVKCGGCASTLQKSLIDDFGKVEVNLDVMPRQITLEINDDQLDKLSQKLKSVGYPLSSDNLSGLENVSTKAKSFVSCAIGKMGQKKD